ncbi:uncharacterized protein LOC110994083 [Pieris rapae]|uniref:uncharacterized protein LOC110994083 n=1 Tax=Pieris rapae TaxID=64459 RepID=UPI000B92AAE3|nr:uncharacterized protein LOC110994083 [Pieris rapae]
MTNFHSECKRIEMLHLLLIFNFICISYAIDTQDTSVLKDNKNNVGSNYNSPRLNTVTFTRTFLDKSDNLLRVPSALYEDKRKSKTKKSPKRTIQKIIKKNNVKRKRIFIHPVTHTPTQSTANNKLDSIYSRQNEDTHTTEANSRKRPRKNSKVLRYHMPFHKLQKTRRNKRQINGHRNHVVDAKGILRSKRDTNGDDIMILKDLDEIEFVDSDKDYNVVRAHVQNVW